MNEARDDKATVLIVDDDDDLRVQLYWLLSEEYRVVQAASRSKALALLQSETVDVVLCDLHLPPAVDGISEGLAIIEAVRAMRPSIPVLVITGSDKKQGGREAVRRGAYGFFEKPIVDEDEIFHIVRQAARMRRLELENHRLRESQNEQMGRGFQRFVGAHPALASVIEKARAVADTNATILLSGETGTGKGMLARAIHESSMRVDRDFVAVSCGALPETLVESELFGYEKGAFTGAHTLKKGRFELADGGTLFLDEIGELSAPVQVKLLRVLQEREFERLGGTKTISVDVRLIAATNRNLEREIAQGNFRQDLFYRLNVVPLRLPSLRERREDIPLLAAHFAAKAAEKHGRSHVTIDPLLIETLCEYEFPGNLRELENLMERITLLQRGGRLDPGLLPDKLASLFADALNEEHGISADDIIAPKDDEATLLGAVASFKRRMVADALQHADGNKTAAAKQLGVSRSYLHRLINELNISA